MNLQSAVAIAAVMQLTKSPTLAAQTFDSTHTTQLAPGIVHQRLVVTSAPWNINVITVELRVAGVTIRAAHANDSYLGRETVLSMADRLSAPGARVLAAINADFFRLTDGEPTNNFVVAGEWWRGVHDWSGGAGVRTQFAVANDGALLLDRFNWSGTLSTRRYPSFALDGLNVRPAADAVSLFTARFGPTTPRDTIGRTLFEIVLRPTGRGGYRIADSVRAGGGSSLRGQLVLAGGGGTRDRLAALGPPGTLVRFDSATDPDRGPIADLVGGLPRLVIDGKGLADTALADAEGTNPNLRQRHPRSAIGFSRDSTRLLLVTVDGRQAASAGMDLLELSRLMLTLGAYQALNLDGGGSTTLVAGGSVLNRPSDPGGPRTVANAVLVVESPRGSRFPRSTRPRPR